MSVVDAGAASGGREDQQCRLRNSADDEARDVSSDAECDCNVQTLGRSAAGAEHARQAAAATTKFTAAPPAIPWSIGG